uniref:Cathepsin M-like isoform X1 n=1 Tax=Mesocricetus auratus TaxID=10036 RepID=A0A1U8CGK8_MESAU
MVQPMKNSGKTLTHPVIPHHRKVKMIQKHMVGGIPTGRSCDSCAASVDVILVGIFQWHQPLKIGKPVYPSVQNLADCVRPDHSSSGSASYALQYVQDNGVLENEKMYPYETKGGPSRHCPGCPAARIADYVILLQNKVVLLNDEQLQFPFLLT